ncbi:GIN domain-containing protein [Sphingomicrobium arenosum]|uniref:GIN domain-containing protein n=1 Tax=Sphingomicrobium arenosum TaxID=2233861 RepID=UPI002240FEBB|nr:DUF2807 domain-containing protein [Sphingomicrobium arenosum]
MRIIALSLLAILAMPAAAQAEERRYSVTDYNQLRIDGGFRIQLETDRSPFAVAEGNSAALDGVRIRVEGRTLIVSANRSNWSGNERDRAQPVTIRLGAHRLERLWVNGSGLIEVDSIEGQKFGLAIQGSGRAVIHHVEVDTLDVGLNGAASAQIGGDVEDATLIVRGMSNLDAQGLEADRATLGVDGPSIVAMGSAQEVRVDAIGVGEISLAGRPACELRLVGAPLVTGCK